jgi:hypothetical protein
MLAARYGPSVQVSLEKYPIPQYKEQLASVISLLKFTLMFICFTSFNPLVTFGFMAEEDPMPEFLAKMKENKIYSCLMIFFISNAIEGQLLSSGAFEIYVDDDLVASKIQTGQIENPKNVIDRLDKLLGKAPGGDNFDGRFH